MRPHPLIPNCILPSFDSPMAGDAKIKNTCKIMQHETDRAIPNNQNTKMANSSLRQILDEELKTIKTYYFNDFAKAESHILRAIPIARELDDTQLEIQLISMKAYNYARKARFDLAKAQFKYLDDKMENIEDPVLNCLFLSNKGAIYQSEEKFADALACYYEALALNIKEHFGALYSNIGMINIQLGNYKKAEKYLNKAEKTKVLNQLGGMANTHSNWGFLYSKIHKFDLAFEQFEKALEVSTQSNNKETETVIWERLGDTHDFIGDFPKAIECYEKALRLANEIGNNFLESYCHRKMGTVLKRMNDLPTALYHFEQGYDKAISLGIFQEKILNLQGIRSILRQQNNMDSALLYSDFLISELEQKIRDIEKQEFEDVIEQQAEDIDNLTKKNEFIEKQNQILYRQNQELKEYAFVIAHDLREPLRSISGFSTLLQRKLLKDYEQNQELSEFISFLIQGCDKMDNQLNSLLEYATIESKGRKEERIIQVSEAFESSIKKMEFRYPDHQLQFNIEVKEDFPLNRILVRNLADHLLTNTIKFKHPEREHRVDINIHGDGKDFIIEITDNGIGIPTDLLQYVFGIFKRIDKLNADGTGIGLAVCRKIVDIYNGEISAISDGESGTTIRIHIPQ